MVLHPVGVLVVHQQHFLRGAPEVDLYAEGEGLRRDAPPNLVRLDGAFEGLSRPGPELGEVEFEKLTAQEEGDQQLARQASSEENRSAAADVQTRQRQGLTGGCVHELRAVQPHPRVGVVLTPVLVLVPAAGLRLHDEAPTVEIDLAGVLSFDSGDVPEHLEGPGCPKECVGAVTDGVG